MTPSPLVPHLLWSRGWRLIGWLAVALWLLAACNNPPPVVDLPAADLDVKITVVDTDANPADGKAPIVVQFFNGGTFVQLSNNVAVSCNGVALTWNGLGYAERVPLVAPGGIYRCTHGRSGVNTSVDIVVPARPVFVAPTQGATVNRSSGLTITYVPGSGTGMRASAGDGSTGLGGNLQADDGTFSSFDVSSLQAGPGSLGLTREFTFTPGGTGFQSAEIKYSSGADINVTWQ